MRRSLAETASVEVGTETSFLEAIQETASLVAGKAPLIGFIASPGASCSQPNPRKDDCHVNWTYVSVDAAPNSMVAMWALLETDVALKVSGFFQTSMYVPGQSLGPGFSVPCGAPIDDPNSCPSPPGRYVPLKVGNSYADTVKALDSAGLRSANYGTVTCPAFVGAGYHTLPPCRVLDTRGAPNGPLPASRIRERTRMGSGGVISPPASPRRPFSLPNPVRAPSEEGGAGL